MSKKPAQAGSEPSKQELEAALSREDGGAEAAAPKKSRAAKAAKPAKASDADPEDDPKPAKPQRAKVRSSDELEADIKARLIGPKKAKKAKPAPVEDEDEEEPVRAEVDEDEDEEHEERSARRRPAAARHDDDFDDEDEEDDRRRGPSEDTLILAEESGLTRSQLNERIARLGSEEAVVAMLSEARRMARRLSQRDEDGERPQRREPAERREEERPAVIPTASNADDIDFDKEFALEGDWDDTAKQLVTQLTKHVSPQIRALAKRQEAALKRIEAHEQRVAQREAMDQQRQLDKLFAEAGPQYAELFGKSPSRKLPASSAYAEARNEIIDEMVAINQSRGRRGLELLEMDELFTKAVDRIHPDVVERRIQEKHANEKRSIRGTPQLRAGGRRSSLPQGREKAIETLTRKQEEYGRR
jgi:hypothetical protein